METSYLWGWVVVGCAAFGLVFALLRALSGLNLPLVKALGGWWLLLVLIVPAQIPRHTDAFAPAFLVFAFEALFQRDGSPDAAGRILAAATAVAIVLGLVTWLIGRFRRRRVAAD
jgi:hypothetical protein